MIAFLTFETVDGTQISTTFERIILVKTVQINEETLSYLYLQDVDSPVLIDHLIAEKIVQLLRSASTVEAILTNSLEPGKFREVRHG